MKKTQNKIWFSAMKYGIGWGLPTAWQGWVVLLAYIVLVLSGIRILRISPGFIVVFILYVLFLTVILFLICWKKGEKPELRWKGKPL
jgi:hypothetical protein